MTRDYAMSFTRHIWHENRFPAIDRRNDCRDRWVLGRRKGEPSVRNHAPEIILGLAGLLVFLKVATLMLTRG